MMAGIFPLFAHQMVGGLQDNSQTDTSQYTKMGYAHASTVVAAIAFALAVAPFLLIRYGAALRARSPFTSSLVHD
jgi:uncharacterized membrane protein (DUF4010 family)